MLNFNKVTQVIRNPDNGNNQGGGGFPRGGSPFQQSGTNIWDSINRKSNNSNDTTNNMQAPNMNQNGMPNGSGNPPNQQQQQSQQQSNIVPNTTIPNNQNNQNTNNQNNQNNPQQGGSPLDKYSQKPDNGNNQGGQQQQQQQQQSNPSNQQQQQQQQQQPSKSIFDSDLKAWTTATENVNLVDGIEAESIQKALGTSGIDVNEFMGIIQQVSRNAMNQAAFMSTSASGKGVTSSMDSFGKTIPEMITNHQFSNMWQGDSVMNHESAQPMVKAMTDNLRQQFPQATPQELQTEVRKYFDTFAQTLTGQQQQEQNQEPEDTTSDLANFFNT